MIGLIFLVSVSVTVLSAELVKLNNVWMLPENNFSAFYRYFPEKMTWYEADNVCEFHHGNLVTAKNNESFEVLQNYLKEFEINETIWIGLNRKLDQNMFSWPDNEQVKNLQITTSLNNGTVDANSTEASNRTDNNNCVAIDARQFDYPLIAMGCDRPVYAPFICEVQIPDWARNETNGCLLTALPSVSIIYVLEDDVFELVSDCGFQHGTKSVSCKDPIDQNLLIKQLKCDFDEENMIDRDMKKESVSSQPTVTAPNNETETVSSTTLATQQPYWSTTIVTRPEIVVTIKPELKRTTNTTDTIRSEGQKTTSVIEMVTTTISSNSPPTPTHDPPVLKSTTSIVTEPTPEPIKTTPSTTTTKDPATTPSLFIATTSPLPVNLTNDTDSIQDYLEIRPNFEQELVDDKIIEINVSLNDDNNGGSGNNDTTDNDNNEKSISVSNETDQMTAIRNLTIIETNSNRSTTRKREIKPYFVSRLIG